MKILITGASGQLGYALQQTQPSQVRDQTVSCLWFSREQLDLASDVQLKDVLNRECPDLIINAAAYTAVDKAESDAAIAFAVNAHAVGILASWSQQHAKHLIHVSTDFVFNGQQSTAYQPLDAVDPIGVYGQSKAEGEKLLAQSGASYHLIRTSWVYCEQGSNFVKTMLRLAAARDTISVVSDQIGAPTYAINLAKMIWMLVEKMPKTEIWHFSDAGVASWYDFACAVFDEATAIGLLERKPRVIPIKTHQYPTPAARPAFSLLDKEQLWSELPLEAIHWRDSLSTMLKSLKR